MAFQSLNIGYTPPAPAVQAPDGGARIDIGELGATGTPIFGGFLREEGEYNPDLTGLSAYRIYERMRRSDAQVSATLQAMKLPIRGAEWAIREPKDATPVEVEAAELVRSCLMDALDLDGIVENALLMLDFGAAVHEDVWYVDGNQIRLKKCAARLPLTFYRWITAENGDDLVALEQRGYRGGQYVTTAVPADKLALFTFRQEGANYTGISALRAMYQHWFIKAGLYKVEAISLERNGMGVPWIKMAAGASVEDRKAAKEWLQSLAVNEATSILLPPVWEFGLEGVKGTIQSPKDAIEHHNSMISAAGLAQFINLGQGHSSGNRALGQTMSDFFYLGLQATANQIARVISLSTIKRLVEMNYGADVRAPKLVAQQILSVKFESVVSMLKELAAAGVVQPDEDLEAWVREKLGAPDAGKPYPKQQQAPVPGQPATPIAALSETGAAVFAPRRAPRGVERYMALSEIDGQLNQGRDAIAAALRAAKPRLLKEIVQKLMSRPVRDAHRVSVEIDGHLVNEVEGVLQGLAQYGAETVQGERTRQLRGKGPATAATLRAAEKRSSLGVYADGVVSEFTNNLQARAANVVTDQRRRPSAGTGQQILDAEAALDDQKDGWVDAVASKGANAAFADGRAEGYAEYADEISECIYSALLDLNTCEQCSGADGESGATPDDITAVPNPDCDGGDKCRCVHVFVFADEVKKAA